jgi:hypothetical protein
MLHASDPRTAGVSFGSGDTQYISTRTHARTHKHPIPPPPNHHHHTHTHAAGDLPSDGIQLCTCLSSRLLFGPLVDIGCTFGCGYVLRRSGVESEHLKSIECQSLDPLSISHELDGIQHQSLHVLFQRMLPRPQVCTFDDIYKCIHTYTHTFTHIHTYISCVQHPLGSGCQTLT